MKRLHRTTLITALVLALPGCGGVQDKTTSKTTSLMIALCYNKSISADRLVGKNTNAPLVTNQISWKVRHAVPTISVFSISKHPISCVVPSKRARYPELMQALEKARQLARDGEPNDPNDAKVTPRAGEQPDIWGYGTDHAATLRKINSERPQRAPLLLVMFTDGFNEDRPFDEIGPQITRLFKNGPTRLIVLGVSQRIVDSNTQTTQLDRWREMLDGLGLTNLGLKPGVSGYYLSSDVALPEGWNNFPP